MSLACQEKTVYSLGDESSKTSDSEQEDLVEFHLSIKVEVMTSFIRFKAVLPAAYPKEPLTMQIEDTFNLKTKEVERLE